MRVKILEAKKHWELEERVNEFLRDIREDQVVDIKYSGTGCFTPYGVDQYSAMVILKN